MIEKINIVKIEKYKDYIKEADKIIGNIHKGDVPFIALALSVQNDGIWTDDKDFLNQNKIKIWKTEIILNLFD